MSTRRLSLYAFAFLAVLLMGSSARLQSQSIDPSLGSPPVAQVRPVTDDYYGTKVVDPYRYMENLKDPQVQAWMKAQNDYTRAMLANIPGREKLLARIQQLDQSVPQVSALRMPGDLYLIRKRLPTESVAKLYIRHGINGQDRLLVDPEKITLAPPDRGKGKNVVTVSVPSQDGKYIAITVVPGGAEHNTELHIIDTATGGETGDVILRAALNYGQGPVGGAPSWLPDNRSFVYGRDQKLSQGAPVTEIEQKYRAYLHVMGTDPQKDRRVFGYGVVPSIKVAPRDQAAVSIQPASEYALGWINSGVAPNSAYYIEPVTALGKTNSAWRKLADLSDDVNDVVVHGNDLYLLTYKNALRYKVLRVEARHPDLSSAETVVPPSQAVVQSIHPAQDALYVRLLDGGIGRVLRVPYGPHPDVEEVPLPLKGTVLVETDSRLQGGLIRMTSWTKAAGSYAYDPETQQVVRTNIQPAGPYGNPANVESTEVKVRSYDGTLVPLSIVYPMNMKRDGANPTALLGYGAYGISETAFFDPLFLAWYERGGVLAMCHVRGGGEYGEEWHLAGKGPTKPNTWRDFIACAQYLIDKKYTSPARLAGGGGSAGGILIGRAITSRPDLFSAAHIGVGVLDTLRFETTANGVPNIPEFGSVKTEVGFKALFAMSAYAHVNDKTPYPAVMLETGANDPRVDPWESAKMTARLQAATKSGKPVLLYVHYAGGHAGVGATEKQFQEHFANMFSFFLWQFGVPGFQPVKSVTSGK